MPRSLAFPRHGTIPANERANVQVPAPEDGSRLRPDLYADRQPAVLQPPETHPALHARHSTPPLSRVFQLATAAQPEDHVQPERSLRPLLSSQQPIHQAGYAGALPRYFFPADRSDPGGRQFRGLLSSARRRAPRAVRTAGTLPV